MGRTRRAAPHTILPPPPVTAERISRPSGFNILGGSGSILGVVIAAFIIGLVTFGLGLFTLPGILMSIFTGILLIVVIALPTLYRTIRQRRRA